MPNYQAGKIYRLVNDVNDIVYVGSTTASLRKRMAGHRYSSDVRLSKSSFYSSMRLVGSDRFEIILVKEFACNSKSELEQEEHRIMQKVMSRGVELYNENTDYFSKSDVYRERMRACKIQRGCLRLTKDNIRWRFEYQPSLNQRKSFSFSVSKYGAKEAKAKAMALQDLIYPL